MCVLYLVFGFITMVMATTMEVTGNNGSISCTPWWQLAIVNFRVIHSICVPNLQIHRFSLSLLTIPFLKDSKYMSALLQ